MKVICLSDTHTMHGEAYIPDADILIHCGDFTSIGKVSEVIRFNDWLGSLNHIKHKIVVAGNHDLLFEESPEVAQSLLTNATYLQDSEVTIDGIRIYGAPWQPRFHDWAFNVNRGADIRRKWDLIPNNLDILVTHGPPMGYLDEVNKNNGDHLGCDELLSAIHRAKPRYHLFGHIHGGYGTDKIGDTNLINCATCDEKYDPVNLPVEFKIWKTKKD